MSIYGDTAVKILAVLQKIKGEYGGLDGVSEEWLASEISASIVPGFLEELAAARRIISHRRDPDSAVDL